MNYQISAGRQRKQEQSRAARQGYGEDRKQRSSRALKNGDRQKRNLSAICRSSGRTILPAVYQTEKTLTDEATAGLMTRRRRFNRHLSTIKRDRRRATYRKKKKAVCYKLRTIELREICSSVHSMMLFL